MFTATMPEWQQPLKWKKMVYELPVQQDGEIVASQPEPRASAPSANDLSNDFTRALFGF
jgi:hypothetical protein